MERFIGRVGNRNTQRSQAGAELEWPIFDFDWHSERRKHLRGTVRGKTSCTERRRSRRPYSERMVGNSEIDNFKGTAAA